MKITAQVIILNELGQVLCVSRKTDHSDMGLPGGKQDPEDFGNALYTAIRETKEETGLDVKYEDMKLVLAMHKYGSMSYTFYATKYTGEINHNEPHIVKWGSFNDLFNGSFGKYNELAYDSLVDMNVVPNLN